MASPLVIGLVVTFALLVVFSFVLWGMIARANAYPTVHVAVEDMEGGNFLNAIKGFDHFLASNPTTAGPARRRSCGPWPGSASTPGGRDLVGHRP